jgi:hypothetical protein
LGHIKHQKQETPRSQSARGAFSVPTTYVKLKVDVNWRPSRVSTAPGTALDRSKSLATVSRSRNASICIAFLLLIDYLKLGWTGHNLGYTIVRGLPGSPLEEARY